MPLPLVLTQYTNMVILSNLGLIEKDQFREHFHLQVKPAFEEFCRPTMKCADVIIPRGGENDVAIDLIVQHIQVRRGNVIELKKIL